MLNPTLPTSPRRTSRARWMLLVPLAIAAVVASSFGSAPAARADSGTGAISGTVLDGSGHPFAADELASVQLYSADGADFVAGAYPSDVDGSWTADNLADGSYLVQVDVQQAHDGVDYEGGYYVAQGHPVSNASDATLVVVSGGQITEGIDFALHVRPTVTGAVRNAAGDPVVGASVTLYNADGALASSTTGDDGSYSIRAFTARTGLTVQVTPSGDALLPQWYNGASDQQSATVFSTIFDHDTALDTVTLDASSSISGQVTDVNGHGISGVQVLAANLNDSSVGSGAITDDEGAYTITGLVRGSYSITFYGDHFQTQYYNHTSDSGQSTPVVLSDANPDASGIDAQLTATGTISGTVSGNGDPVAGVVATATNVDDPDLSYTSWETDDSGAYTIDQLPNADYTVSFTTSDDSSYYVAGSRPGTVSVTVGAEDATGIDYSMEYGGAVSGTVRLGTKPFTDATVSVTRNGQWVKYGGVDQHGGYRVSGLAAGVYTLDFEPSDSAYAGNTATVTIVAGRDKTGVNGIVQKSVVQADLYVKSKRTDSITVGETLSVGTHPHSVSVPAKVTSTYRWVRIDPISEVQRNAGTKSTYPTTNADAGYYLGVYVTQSASGYASATQFLVNPAIVSGAKFTKVPKLSISGTLATGNTVKAKFTGSWSPAPTDFTYSWAMNGIRVPASWSRTPGTMYLGWDDLGNGNPYDSGNPPTKDSDPRLSVKGDADNSEDASNPVGDPSSHDYPFQFTQLLQPQWNGQRLTLTVCAGHGDYYNQACKTVTVHVARDLSKRVIPVISKNADTNVWTANAGVWHSSTYTTGTVALKYQWMRDGSPIAGATKAGYALTSADSGHLVTVTVTGSAKGYTTAKTYSLNTALAP